jgi:CBS domain-containing protein
MARALPALDPRAHAAGAPSANIVFDFRPLYGDTTLADGMREWLSGFTRDNRLFLRFMVENALQSEPPLGLVRAFVTDDDGNLDLKVRVRASSSTPHARSPWALLCQRQAPRRACASPATSWV